MTSGGVGAIDGHSFVRINEPILGGRGGFRGLQVAHDMALRGSIRRSPVSVAPYQIDFCPILTRHAVVGNVRSRRDVNSVVELAHVGVEVIDDDLTAVLVLTNGERAVDQTKGLADMAALRVSADNLHRIFAQQILDGVIVEGSGSGVAHDIENDGSGRLNSPIRAVVLQSDGLRGFIGTGKGMPVAVSGHILICMNGDNTGVVAVAALNVADSEGTSHEGICNISVARVGDGAVNLHRIAVQQIHDGGFAGFVGLDGGRIGVLRYEIDRSTLVAGGRTALVKRPRFGICIGFFRPTDDLVAAVNSSAICGGLNVRNRDCVVVICGVAVRRGILANKLGLFGRTVIVANVEFVTHIQDGEGDIDLMPGVQSGGSYTGSGNRRQGQCSCTGLDRVPLGGICDIRSHGFRNGGLPAGEGIAFPFGSAVESGGRGTSR